jgi:hypothetical protein
MRRALLGVMVVGSLVVAPAAAADPVRNPHVVPLAVVCQVDGTPVVFRIVGTGRAGHRLEGNGVAVLGAGTISTFVNGVLVDQESSTSPGGQGRRGTPCTATLEFEDPAGNEIRIVLEAELLLTPARQ